MYSNSHQYRMQVWRDTASYADCIPPASVKYRHKGELQSRMPLVGMEVSVQNIDCLVVGKALKNQGVETAMLNLRHVFKQKVSCHVWGALVSVTPHGTNRQTKAFLHVQ